MAKKAFDGAVIMAPLPCVMVTSGTQEKPNVMTVAWTGILNTHPAKTYISVRPSRHSHKLITESGEFVINLVPSTLVRALDFCGVRSGKDTDKFKLMNLTAEESVAVSAPTLAESPLSLECRVFDTVSLGTHDMFLADILAVTVREELLDDTGRLCLERAHLIAYSHGTYFGLGKQLGQFGFSAVKRRHTDKKR